MEKQLFARIDGQEHKLDTVTKALWWQERGLSFTRTGYGRRIPTRRMVRLPGDPRWRRVYCAVFGNNGTCYVEDKKNRDEKSRPAWIIVTD
jgi:hypothetical protein